jgi:hypothetical protein
MSVAPPSEDNTLPNTPPTGPVQEKEPQRQRHKKYPYNASRGRSLSTLLIKELARGFKCPKKAERKKKPQILQEENIQD